MALITAGLTRGLGSLAVVGSSKPKGRTIGLTVQIVNKEQLEFAFNQAPKLMDRNLKKGINRSILRVGRQAAINSPVDTGRMRASILGGKFSNRTGRFSPFAGVDFARGKKFSASVGPSVDYAIYVHEGTRYMRPRPFLENAVKQRVSDVEAIMQKSVQDTLDAIGGLV